MARSSEDDWWGTTGDRVLGSQGEVLRPKYSSLSDWHCTGVTSDLNGCGQSVGESLRWRSKESEMVVSSVIIGEKSGVSH